MGGVEFGFDLAFSQVQSLKLVLVRFLLEAKLFGKPRCGFCCVSSPVLNPANPAASSEAWFMLLCQYDGVATLLRRSPTGTLSLA